MKEKGIDKQLRMKIEELFEKTRSKILVKKRGVKKLGIRKEVRQGCPLNAVLSIN